MTARRVGLLHAVEDAWRAQRLDAVICPAAATPAVPIDMAQDAGLMFSYFSRFNLLGMPAGVVPFTRVRSGEAQMPSRGDRVDQRIAAISARSVGLPVAVQVVAPRWHDRTALRVMAAVEAAAEVGVADPARP
jgi:fatty acid amide hydrolase